MKLRALLGLSAADVRDSVSRVRSRVINSVGGVSMSFSPEPPQEPGFYWLRTDRGETIVLLRPDDLEGCMTVAYIEGDSYRPTDADLVGAEWCRVEVPE